MSEARPGGFRTFLPLALPCFLWFAADDVAEALLSASGGGVFALFRAAELVVGSLVAAGVLGSMADGLARGEEPTARSFLQAVRRYGARFLGAYAAITVLALVGGGVLLAAAGMGPEVSWRQRALFAGTLLFPLTTLRLLWTGEIVAENARRG